MKQRWLQHPIDRRAESQRRAWKLHRWTTLPLVILMLLIVVVAIGVRGVEFLRSLFA